MNTLPGGSVTLLFTKVEGSTTLARQPFFAKLSAHIARQPAIIILIGTNTGGT